jgi:hypothetical protein
MSKEMLEQLEKIRESVLRTHERTLTARQIETAVWGIWNYCKLNEGSMVSERHIKGIQEMVEKAVQRVQLRLEDTVSELRDTRKKLTEARQATKAEHKALQKTLLRVEALTTRLKESTSKMRVATKVEEKLDEIEVTEEELEPVS